MKSLGTVSARYEMFPLVVSYTMALITKMVYKDKNNDTSRFEMVCKIWCPDSRIKIWNVGDDDNDEDQATTTQDALAHAPQVQDSGAPSLVEVMSALKMLGEKFERFQDQV